MTTTTAVLLPLLGGPALWILARRRAGWNTGGGAVTALLLGLVASVAAAATGSTASWAWGAGLHLNVSAAGVAGPVAALVAFVGLVVVAYAAVHEDPADLPRLLGLMVCFVGVMQLLVMADDLLTLLIAWELSTALSWALIGFDWSSDVAVGHAGHAFVVTRAGSLGLVAAACVTFAATGSVAYGSVGQLGPAAQTVVAAGLLLAAASKSAQLPFSPWLYSAMAGPTPVSALLHSATMVAAGAYLMIRVAPSLTAVGWFGPALVAVGLSTALGGGALALVENHPKRILAASTAAQYGLMFVAVGVGAVGAAAAHLVAHGLFKSLLFLVAGIGMAVTGSEDVRRWHLGGRLPGIAVMAGIGSGALAALPPLGGAWTKEQITAGALAAGPMVGVLTLLAGLLSAAYAARFQLLAFGGRDRAAQLAPAVSRVERAAVALLAGASVVLGALWLPGGRQLVGRLTGEALEHGQAFELAVSVLLVAAGGMWAWAGARHGHDPARWLPARWREVSPWFGIPTAAKRLVADPTLAVAAALAHLDVAVVDAPARAGAAAVTWASRALPTFDDTVVDGAVRSAARLGRASAAALDRWVERGVDGVIIAMAAATARVGGWLRVGDDRGIDATVEGIARMVGTVGHWSRALQSGLVHQYYVIAVIGLAALLVVAAVGR